MPKLIMHVTITELMNFYLSEKAYSANALKRCNKKRKILYQLHNNKILSVSKINGLQKISLDQLSLLSEMTEQKLIVYWEERKSFEGEKPVYLA